MQNNSSESKQFIIKRLEEEYNYKKITFLIENPDKSEKDFIENEITIIKKTNDEFDRKCNLTDDEVYEEIKKEKKYLNSCKYATTSEIEEFLKHSLKQYREKFKHTEKKGFKSIFYNTKLKNFLKTEKNINVKENKSLLLKGEKLNLSERYTIANKILKIDSKLRILNIQDLQKYQLLAYILGCDKDNARNLMNGTYKSKDRDLTDFFNDLGLNQ
ncbi:hypothetical protein [Flavobacterium sp. GSA192]|uniref:hypothetical protein n=1 Tax=Flavobacterium sp. GSA192 TaxID=2576304 RepID=UPI0011263CC3|nr:hypothetical protein [Flavobacterium sp. GSA192]